jgi:acetyl esterase/lipase
MKKTPPCWMLAAVLVCGWSVLPGGVRAGEPPVTTIRNVVYLTRESGPLKADIFQPTGEGPFPGVLCVHGGAWISGNKAQLSTIARRLAAEGYTAVSINYRLAPRHKFPAQIADCREALQWMRKNAGKYKIDPERIAAWGYSAGGHLVTLLGVGGNGLKAVVAGGAPCDFRQTPLDSPVLAFWLGGTRREVPEAYQSASPAAFVSADDPPTLFYHGQHDRLVKTDQPTAMAAELKRVGVPARLYLVPDAGHVEAFLKRAALTEGVKFLKERL